MASPDNEFKDLTVTELKAVAASFAVDLDGFVKKADIIKEIEENGVTFADYKLLLEPDTDDAFEPANDLEPTPVDPGVTEVPLPDEPAEEPEAVEEVVPDEVLVKMTRPNFSYQVRGHKFSREHPFLLVSEEDADYLVEHEGGFRTATPREAREYYGI